MLSGFINSFGQAETALQNDARSATLETVLGSLRSSRDPERTLRTSAKQLVRLLDCGGFALFAHGELISSAGRLPNGNQLRQLAPLLEKKLEGRASYSTDRLAEDVAHAPPLAADASGVLAVRIEGCRPLLAVWLRAEQIEEICWAGDPKEKDASLDPLKALSPRHSFATWRETVRGRSRPWTQHDSRLVELLSGRAEFTMQRHRLRQLNEELSDANATLGSLATTDPLTGLANRRLFDERMATEWHRAQRHGNSVAIVAIDVDNFKKYNDTFGHPAGDECLKQVATAIADGHRHVDVAARLGGEEFGMLLTDVDSGEAAAVAERVRLAIERLCLDHPLNETGVVTISLGVAAGTLAQWGDLSRLVTAADQALYEAKANGRNCFRTASPEVGQ